MSDGGRKEDGVFLKAFLAAARWLLSFSDHFRSRAADTFAFYAEFFSGIPLLVAYLRRTIKKRKRARAAKKNKESLIKREKKIDRASVKREQKEDEKLEKRIRRREKREKRQNERSVRSRRFLHLLPLLLVASLIVLELSFAGRYAALYVYDSFVSREKAVTMNVYFSKNDQRKTTIPASVAYVCNDSSIRFDMTFFAKELNIQTFGSYDSVLYSMPGGQKLRVYDHSNTVLINGREVSLRQTVLFKDTNVYIPLELLQNYTLGFGISYNSDARTLTLIYDKSAKDLMTADSSDDYLYFLPYGDYASELPLLI